MPGEKSMKRYSKNPNSQAPRVVSIRDVHGDDLLHDTRSTVREDLHATRHRPLDAPMADYTDDPDWMVLRPRSYLPDPSDIPTFSVIGQIGVTLLLMAASFIAGLIVGGIA